MKESFRILVVDDERSFSLLISRILGDEGYRVKTAADPREALAAMHEFEPDLVITDLKMPEMDGVAFMKQARELHPQTDFIMITAFGTVESAVSAMKLGALDYITKPLKEPEELRQVVRKAYEKNLLISENRTLRDEIEDELPPLDLVFAGMDPLREEIQSVARTDATVILYGETGTGKSIVANMIHRLSRREGLLVAINCAAIPDNLLESELFGYEKGAFTGAGRMKKGKIERAVRGTLFLDEIAEMSTALQAKLLNVLQEKTFERLGGLDPIRTDARIVVATNRDLKSMVAGGKFREDLYYRLNVFPVHIPPLRERKTVIPQLTRYFVKKVSLQFGKQVIDLPDESMQRLLSYAWPGNIRELRNTIERAIIIMRDGILLIPPFAETGAGTLEGDMKSIEKRAIIDTLGKTGGSRKAAAELLGISLRSLQYKLKEYNITG